MMSRQQKLFSRAGEHAHVPTTESFPMAITDLTEERGRLVDQSDRPVEIMLSKRYAAKQRQCHPGHARLVEPTPDRQFFLVERCRRVPMEAVLLDHSKRVQRRSPTSGITHLAPHSQRWL